LVWVASMLLSRLLHMPAETMKVASPSMEAAMATGVSVHTLADEAQVTHRCRLAFLVPAQCPQASLQLRRGTLQLLQASAAHALALLLRHTVRPARSTRRHHLVYRQRRQVTIHRRLRATRLHHRVTRRLRRRSLQPRPHTALPHQHTWELLRRTTVQPRHVSVLRHPSIARQARNSIRLARGARQRHRHLQPSVPRARHTRQPALLATLNTLLRRRAILPPHRAQHHTLQSRDGRQLARSTRLRKSPPVIVVPLSLRTSEANVCTGLQSNKKTCAYRKPVFDTWIVS
jgi:hypothetical protein